MPTKTTTPPVSLTAQINADVRVACPIYVGISHDLARQIMERLRDKVDSDPVEDRTNIRVQTFQVSSTQRQMETRLRCDLKTLRVVLFDASKSLNLDLALRIQKELPEFVFLSDKMLQQGFDHAVAHYRYHAETH